MTDVDDEIAGEKAAKATEKWFAALGTLVSPVFALSAKYPKASRGALIGLVVLFFPAAGAGIMRYGGADWVLEKFSQRLISAMKVAVHDAVKEDIGPLKAEADSTKSELAAHVTNDALARQPKRAARHAHPAPIHSGSPALQLGPQSQSLLSRSVP